MLMVDEVEVDGGGDDGSTWICAAPDVPSAEASIGATSVGNLDDGDEVCRLL